MDRHRGADALDIPALEKICTVPVVESSKELLPVIARGIELLFDCRRDLPNQKVVYKQLGVERLVFWIEYAFWKCAVNTAKVRVKIKYFGQTRITVDEKYLASI